MDTPATQNTDAAATEPQTPTPEVESAPGGSDTQSIVSLLREKRNQLGAQSKPLDIAVPGYDGLLILRCRWIPFKDLTAGAKDLAKITEVTERLVRDAADTLVVTCQEFLIRVDDELRPLADDGVPVTFGDPRLPEALGFPPASTAVDTCRAVFNNEYALLTTASKVTEWLQDTTRSVQAGVLGN